MRLVETNCAGAGEILPCGWLWPLLLLVLLALGWDFGFSLLHVSDTAFAYSAHHGLHQPVNALFRAAVLGSKSEFRLSLGTFDDVYGHLAAQVIFDECRFITCFFGIPGINANIGEVARLGFWPARPRHKILGLGAR